MTTFQRRLTPVAVAVALACAGQSAHAFDTLEFANGASLETRINLTYTLSARMEDIDPLLAANTGANDGDNNFDDGALTGNRMALLFESKLAKPLSDGGDLGFVLSASTFYDDVYQRDNDNDRGNGLPGAGYNPNGVNKPPPFNDFSAGAERYHSGYSRLLDTYAYRTFDIGKSWLGVRLSRHIMS